MTKLSLSIAIGLLLSGCSKKEEPAAVSPPEPAKQENKEPTPAPAEDAANAATSVDIDLADVGFATPESVLYDADADVYLVSNINGSPFDADDNGFIARVRGNGEMETLRWIDGAKDDVVLNAPKGMAFRGDELLVSDINVVRIFDRTTGEPKGEVAVEGAVFLNDLTYDGNVAYVSDSSFGPDFASTGSDAIYRIGQDNAVSTLIKDPKLGAPNGVLAVDGVVWVVTGAADELYSVDAEGKKSESVKLPSGNLDGLELATDGTALISSWGSSTVYAGKLGGTEFKPMAEGLESPADIGYDSKRNRVVVPLFTKDALRSAAVSH